MSATIEPKWKRELCGRSAGHTGGRDAAARSQFRLRTALPPAPTRILGSELTLRWSQDWDSVQDLLVHRVHRWVGLLGDIVVRELSARGLDLLDPVALGGVGVPPPVSQTLDHLDALARATSCAAPLDARFSKARLRSLPLVRDPGFFTAGGPSLRWNFYAARNPKVALVVAAARPSGGMSKISEISEGIRLRPAAKPRLRGGEYGERRRREGTVRVNARLSLCVRARVCVCVPPRTEARVGFRRPSPRPRLKEYQGGSSQA